MLVSFENLLQRNANAGTAVGAFTCYDLETARAVLAAAAERGPGVVLLVSRESFAAAGGDQLLAGVRAAAERAPAGACVQLDHVSGLDLIESAFELGAGAVMADGSRLAFDENLALVQEAQEHARRAGGAVEAELGHVAGGEDVAVATEAGGLTDPDEARRFADASNVACLAISIGNVHGTYASEPDLDWDRLGPTPRPVQDPLPQLCGAGMHEGGGRRGR